MINLDDWQTLLFIAITGPFIIAVLFITAIVILRGR